jgi:amino acid transporter
MRSEAPQQASVHYPPSGYGAPGHHAAPVKPQAAARRRPGTLQLVVLLTMAHAPFVPLYGFLPTIYQYSGSIATPLVLAFGGVIMVVFCIAYAGMARRIRHSGGLYALVAAGLGPVAGLAAAALALVAYLAYLSGVLVFFGGALRGLVFGLVTTDLPLWLSVVLATAILGGTALLRLGTVVKLLAVLGVLQLIAVGWLDLSAVANPANGSVSFEAIDPASLLTGSFVLATCLVLTVFVGSEVGLNYADEVAAPERTIPRATVISYLIVVVILVLSAWAISVALGPEDVVAIAQGSYQSLTGTKSQPLIIEVVIRTVDPTHVKAVSTLLTAFLTMGALAVGTAITQSITRLISGLARDGALPAALRPRERSGRPRHSTLAAVTAPALCGVGALVAVTSDSPWMALYQGMIGGLGVTLLIALASVAIVLWFLRSDDQEVGYLGWEVPVVAGAFTAIATGFIYFYGLIRLPDVLGADGSIARWLFPLSTLGAIVAGVGWALGLRLNRPGALSNVGRSQPAVVGGSPPRIGQ